jgi:hypothetical protein
MTCPRRINSSGLSCALHRSGRRKSGSRKRRSRKQWLKEQEKKEARKKAEKDKKEAEKKKRAWDGAIDSEGSEVEAPRKKKAKVVEYNPKVHRSAGVQFILTLTTLV